MGEFDIIQALATMGYTDELVLLKHIICMT